MLADIDFAVGCITLLAVFAQFKRLKHTVYKYFLPYLLFIIIYKYGSLLGKGNINNSNLYITNIVQIISFTFYSFFLQNLLQHAINKQIIRTLIFTTLFCDAINMAFIQGFWRLDSITILIQLAVIIIIACLYFYELINAIEIEISIIRLPAFWLNTGLLFYCLSNLLIFFYITYKNDRDYLLLIGVISSIANIILYSCLTLCFCVSG